MFKVIMQKRPFVHNSVCSQFLEALFAILAECSQFWLSVRKFGWVFAIPFEVLSIEIQEEIHHFAGREGGFYPSFERVFWPSA